MRLECAQIPAWATHCNRVSTRRRFYNVRTRSTLLYRTVHKIRDPFISTFVFSLGDHALTARRGLRDSREWNICHEFVSPGLNLFSRARDRVYQACPRRSGENPDRPGRQDNFTVSSSLHGRPPGILLPGAVCCEGCLISRAWSGSAGAALKNRTPRGRP